MDQVFSERDIARWHWDSAIRGAAAGKLTGFAAEADQELRRRYFADPAGAQNRQVGSPHRFIVPDQVFMRDMTAQSSPSSAGSQFLVGQQQVGFIDLLAPQMVTGRLGATRLSGLVGNVTIPKMTAGNTAYWLADEGTQITESQPTIGQTILMPKTIGVYTEVSRQLMAQATPTVDRILGPEMLRRIAVELDKAAIDGSGASGEPQGILQTNFIGTFTGTSLDLAALVNAQSDLASANADPTKAGYATTPAVAALLMARNRFTNTDSPLWQGGIADGRVAGLPAIASTNMPTATMICGQWDQLILASWAGGVEIMVNPFADFSTGKIAMRALALVDVAVALPVAFTAATSIT